MDEQCNSCAICKPNVHNDGIALTHKGSEGVNRASDTILNALGDMVYRGLPP